MFTTKLRALQHHHIFAICELNLEGWIGEGRQIPGGDNMAIVLPKKISDEIIRSQAKWSNMKQLESLMSSRKRAERMFYTLRKESALRNDGVSRRIEMDEDTGSIDELLSDKSSPEYLLLSVFHPWIMYTHGKTPIEFTEEEFYDSCDWEKYIEDNARPKIEEMLEKFDKVAQEINPRWNDYRYHALGV